MQINLLPKTREDQKIKKRITYLVTVICIGLLSVTGLLFIILGSINLISNNNINNLNKDIEKTKDDINVYSDLEKDVNFLTSRLDIAEKVFENRKKWDIFLGEIQKFMPKETFLTELEMPGDNIKFKIASPTIGKVAEFIESMRKYEIEINNKNNNDDVVHEENNNKKLFQDLEVSAYSKETKDGIAFYLFEVKAKFIDSDFIEDKFLEDLWKKE